MVEYNQDQDSDVERNDADDNDVNQMEVNVNLSPTIQQESSHLHSRPSGSSICSSASSEISIESFTSNEYDGIIDSSLLLDREEDNHIIITDQQNTATQSIFSNDLSKLSTRSDQTLIRDNTFRKEKKIFKTAYSRISEDNEIIKTNNKGSFFGFFSWCPFSSFHDNNEERTDSSTKSKSKTKYQTFTCPYCNTTQRNFFSVESSSSSPSSVSVFIPSKYERPLYYFSLYITIYLLSAILFYKHEEHWTVLNTIYFSVITLTSVGFGDFVPQKKEGKIVTTIMIYFGVGCIGLFMGSLLAQSMEHRTKREEEDLLIDSCPYCYSKENCDPETLQFGAGKESFSTLKKTSSSLHGTKKSSYDYNDNDLNNNPGNKSISNSWLNFSFIKTPEDKNRQFLLNNDSPYQLYNSLSFTPKRRRKNNFMDDNHMSSRYAHRKNSYVQDTMGASIFNSIGETIREHNFVYETLREACLKSVIIIGIGTIGFYLIESLDFVDSMYLTTVLLTSVGYGDIVPETTVGKMFTTVYVLLGGTILLNYMSSVAMIPLEVRRMRLENQILFQFGDELDDEALRELAAGPIVRRLQLLSGNRTNKIYDRNNRNSSRGVLNECTREMFTLAMLVRLGKISEKDVLNIFKAFKKLDVGNDGVLDSRDIIASKIKKEILSRKRQERKKKAEQEKR